MRQALLSRFCALVLLLQFNKNIVPVTLPGGGGGCSLSRLDFGLTLGFWQNAIICSLEGLLSRCEEI